MITEKGTKLLELLGTEAVDGAWICLPLLRKRVVKCKQATECLIRLGYLLPIVSNKTLF